jgi:hypothetical protein
MHTGNAQASETVNEKLTTANLTYTGYQIIIMFMEFELCAQE